MRNGTLLLIMLTALTMPVSVLATTMTSPGFQISNSITTSGASTGASPAFGAVAAASGHPVAITASMGSSNYKVKPFSLASLGVVSPTFGSGDINGDGKVVIADALVALQIAIGNLIPTQDQRGRGDVAPLISGTPHPDGVMDAGDALVILEKVVGLKSW